MGWFVPLRLASFVMLMLVVAFWLHYPPVLQPVTIAYSVMTLALAVVVAAERRRSLGRMADAVIGLHFLLEIYLEAGMVYQAGEISPPYSGLFLLTIVSAALVYRLVGTVVVATVVSSAYAISTWLSLHNQGLIEGEPLDISRLLVSQDLAVYAVFLHFLLFYLAAFVAGYLAEKLSSQDQKLRDASAALRRARLETDDILRHLNSGLLTIDAQGYLIYFNRAAEKILGYREDEIRGLLCEEVFAERMPELAECLMDGVRYGLPHPRREITIRSADRTSLPLGLSTSVLTEERRQLRGVIAIFSDLTDAKVLEAKIRSADRLAAIGELSASIAHEIRNPLAAISGSVEVLNRELRPTDENARLMELIVKESHRLSKILSDFLSYARIERPAFHRVELCRLTNDVVELLQHRETTDRRVTLSVTSDQAVTYVYGDSDLLKQLLVNLVLNACEAFDGRGGRVVIQIHSAEPAVLLRVIDNGPGIPAEHMDRIFQPFYSTKRHGSGLGLAIVHRICSALHLQLGVESKSGEGTCFTVTFPFEQGGVHPHLETDRAAVASGR